MTRLSGAVANALEKILGRAMREEEGSLCRQGDETPELQSGIMRACNRGISAPMTPPYLTSLNTPPLTGSKTGPSSIILSPTLRLFDFFSPSPCLVSPVSIPGL